MARISAALKIEHIGVEDPGAFEVEVIGFIASEVGGEIHPESPVKWSIAFDDKTAFEEGATIAVGRVVSCDLVLDGFHIEFNPFGIEGFFVGCTALKVE